MDYLFGSFFRELLFRASHLPSTVLADRQPVMALASPFWSRSPRHRGQLSTSKLFGSFVLTINNCNYKGSKDGEKINKRQIICSLTTTTVDPNNGTGRVVRERRNDILQIFSSLFCFVSLGLCPAIRSCFDFLPPNSNSTGKQRKDEFRTQFPGCDVVWFGLNFSVDCGCNCELSKLLSS
jgi:hypothetical protein